MKKLLSLFILLLIFLAVGYKFNLLNPSISQKPIVEKQIVVYEESVITQVVANAVPSVVTVGMTTVTQPNNVFQFDPFNFSNPFQQIPGQPQKVDQNIGSGFIISPDGLIITNKHVVSDTTAAYSVLTNDKKTYPVDKIYRDPLNDLAILKINASSLKPLTLGNSTNLKLGQMTIAIGTPLGQFTNSVTHGIISGLGRGITTGSALEGYVEQLDNVIQTDAPINPGNSGGPLLNSSGQVIGINTAIAQGGQDIGFAIPANVIQNLIDSFNKSGGSFERPYIGITYRMIDKQNAIANNVVEGAYVVQVIDGSPAQKAGIQTNDIITEFDGVKINGSDNQSLTKLIVVKKIGDTASLKIWRDKEIKTINLTIEAAK